MLDLIKETGLNFTSGQNLTSKAMNTLNDSLNSLIRAINILMKSEININVEEESKKMYTIEEAINLVPKSRRIPGIKVTFLGTSGMTETYTYSGGDWESLESWGIGDDETIIDGGEW